MSGIRVDAATLRDLLRNQGAIKAGGQGRRRRKPLDHVKPKPVANSGYETENSICGAAWAASNVATIKPPRLRRRQKDEMSEASSHYERTSDSFGKHYKSPSSEVSSAAPRLPSVESKIVPPLQQQERKAVLHGRRQQASEISEPSSARGALWTPPEPRGVPMLSSRRAAEPLPEPPPATASPRALVLPSRRAAASELAGPPLAPREAAVRVPPRQAPEPRSSIIISEIHDEVVAAAAAADAVHLGNVKPRRRQAVAAPEYVQPAAAAAPQAALEAVDELRVGVPLARRRAQHHSERVHAEEAQQAQRDEAEQRAQLLRLREEYERMQSEEARRRDEQRHEYDRSAAFDPNAANVLLAGSYFKAKHAGVGASLLSWA